MSRNTANPKTARLSVSLDEQTYRTICAIARDDDVSVAWVIRRAVSNLVKNRETANDMLVVEPLTTARRARGR